MRFMLAHRLAASPWMNPARWTSNEALRLDIEGEPGGWARDHYEVTLAEGSEREAIAEAARNLVLSYRIFPPEILEPALPDLQVRPGDTIVQGIKLGLVGLIAAVRVTTVFDRERDGIRRTGFSYVTLSGHPERGGMTCAVVDNHASATVTFEIDVISQPGHWLTRLGRPFARRMQRIAAQAALARVAQLASAADAGDQQP